MIAGMKPDALEVSRLRLRVSRAQGLLLAADDHTRNFIEDALVM
jgi:hypothetical protein